MLRLSDTDIYLEYTLLLQPQVGSSETHKRNQDARIWRLEHDPSNSHFSRWDLVLCNLHTDQRTPMRAVRLFLRQDQA